MLSLADTPINIVARDIFLISYVALSRTFCLGWFANEQGKGIFHLVNDRTKNEQTFSFVCLMALLMSFIALAIDALLPALNLIAQDLKLANPSHAQWLISSIFIGMGLGTLFFGPFSDAYGRRSAIALGLIIFLFGSALCIKSEQFNTLLIGRFLQGLGGATCRVVTMAMIRDQFEGNQMAKLMSFIAVIFILVPALAPGLGQMILWITTWHGIFYFKALLAVVCLIWLLVQQTETLPLDKRRPFTAKQFLYGAKQVLGHRETRFYMLAAAFIFGPFVAYLNTAQQVIQQLYATDLYFTLIFGTLALVIGCSSFINGKLVEQWGMFHLSKKAVNSLFLVCLLYLPFNLSYQGIAPLPIYLSFLAFVFFCLGILFGNLSTLALVAHKNNAGMANSIISSVQILISVLIGSLLGHLYSDNTYHIHIGFCISALFCVLLFRNLEKPVPSTFSISEKQ
jgi:DHA1 family bicyclomycin/chloramphenicol resistance-like MFS transporter